jgi:uncharacterized membrane protein
MELDLLKDKNGTKALLILSMGFFILMLVFSLHRFYTFYASYDQALFDQLFWNSIHGRLFQGSLSAGQSVGYLQDGEVHKAFYSHLAQHFVIDFFLWMPIYALFPTGATLVVLQVSLITIAGIVLYVLSRHYLPTNISLLITASFYGGNAVIAPTFANFYEHCQIPLFIFSLLLALEKRKISLFWLFLFFSLGIREEAGIITFGIGLYLIFIRRYIKLGIAVCLISFTYVAVVTNVIMPLLSDDNSRLYLTTRFSRFVPGNPNPSTLQLLWGMITNPIELLKSLLFPFDRRVKYFLGHWLPLAFIPAISPTAWLITIPQLIVLLIQNSKLALALSVRFALTIVPGMFYGAILWWSQHPERFKPRVKRFWIGCIALSIAITIFSSPNRVFYFLIPDSFRPWVYVSLPRQWEHVGHIRSLMKHIPSDGSVCATTYLLPHLATRRVITRGGMQVEIEPGKVIDVDYAFADLWQLLQYQPAFKSDRQDLKNTIAFLNKLLASGKYGLVGIEDGVVLLQKNLTSTPEVQEKWRQLQNIV